MEHPENGAEPGTSANKRLGAALSPLDLQAVSLGPEEQQDVSPPVQGL